MGTAKPDTTTLGAGFGGARRATLTARVAEARAALARAPEDPDALAALGRALAMLGGAEGLAEAEALFHRALARVPERLDLLACLGSLALRRGRPEDALPWFDRVLACSPDHADARYNRGLAHLMRGSWTAGFADYAARFAAAGLDPPVPQSPRWRGQPLEHPQERPLLVATEQGLGDALHFLRFLPAARARAGAVVLACRPALGRLLSSAPGLDGLVPLGVTPPHGAAIPLMDLPTLPGLEDPLACGAPVPYLAAEADRAAAWRTRLEALDPPGRLRVGVAWRGSPTHGLDHERSLDPALLAPLAEVPGVILLALHPDCTPAEQAEAEAAGILCPPPDADWQRDALVGTAGLMASLDLVVTVDTVFAHLAGALGRPVWTLLPPVPDWRWGLAGEATPWYPTMRLYRGDRPGAWDSPLAAVVRDLNRRAQRSRRHRADQEPGGRSAPTGG